VEEDSEVCRFAEENEAKEQGRTVEEDSMLEEYCAVQAVTTEGIGIDAEIDQCQTVPPSNYDLLES
jgi:hypothetical protein